MKEITRNDFNLFQDEILGLLKKFDSKSTEKITELTLNVQKTDLMSAQKFENFKYEIEGLIKNLETNEIILKLSDRINLLNNKIEELQASNNIKITNFERNLSNACYKYDKIFLNNISSPGLIGDGCPYPTMRSFLEYSNSKIKEFMNSKEKFGIDFQKYHDWVKSTLDKFREELLKYKEENYNYIKTEIKQYDKRSMDKMNTVEDKLSLIRVENGSYNFKLNKKWEELQEKLQMFYIMNDNLIRIYNKTRQEFLKTQNDLNNIIQYLNYIKSSPNGNKINYDKFNRKIELTKPSITNPEHVLPAINSFEDITKNMFNTPINNLGNNESKVNNKNNNAKIMRLFKKKQTVDLGKTGFSFNKLDQINKQFSINTYTNADKNEKEEMQNNPKSDLSEKKLLKRKITFRRSNLIIEEKNEIYLLNKNEAKSERVKKDLQEIKEDKNDSKEKKDEQTSPFLSKNTSYKVFNNLVISPNKINSFSLEKKVLNKDNKEEIPKEEKKTSTINQKNYDEEFNEIKSKFEDLYVDSNKKINIIMENLNDLIIRMNKIIIFKKDKSTIFKGLDYLPEKKHKKLFLDHSGTKIILPLNKSYDEKNNKTTTKESENEKEHIKNLKQDLKINNKLIINDKYVNDIFKYDGFKVDEIRGNSSDVLKLLNGKKQKIMDYYEGKVNIQSINKIENYLIKKFTEPN